MLGLGYESYKWIVEERARLQAQVDNLTAFLSSDGDEKAILGMLEKIVEQQRKRIEEQERGIEFLLSENIKKFIRIDELDAQIAELEAKIVRLESEE